MALLGALGCEARVGNSPSGGETSSGTTAPAASTSGLELTATEATSIGSGSTTTLASSSDGDSTTGGSSTSGCHCELFDADHAHVGPEGYSFLDLLASFERIEVPWVWSALSGDPTTNVVFELVSLDDASYEQASCGEPGCSDVGGEVRVRVTSDDGHLAEEMVGSLIGERDDTVRLETQTRNFDEFEGSLSMQTIVDDADNPVEHKSAMFWGRAVWNGTDYDLTIRLLVSLAPSPPLQRRRAPRALMRHAYSVTTE